MHEGMSQGEISATQECCQIIEDLKKSGISQVDRNNLNNLLIIKKRELFAEREKYNKAISLLRNIKTPNYTSDVNKRGNPGANYMAYGVVGAEDPFYDEFMKLYPKRGFWGFVRIIQSYLKIYLMMILTMLQENTKKLMGLFL